jgi:hypothetical protein
VRFPTRTDGRANYYVDVIYASSPRAPVAPPAPAPTGAAPLPPLGAPSCVAGATSVSTAAAVRSDVQAGRSVCVTADVGDVNLDSLSSSTDRYIGTSGGGALGAVSISGSSHLNLRARMRSVEIRDGSSFITVEQSIIGGTATNRVYDQLIFMPDPTSDVTIRDNDIGWTLADDSGNTGYGCRCYGRNDRLRFERNRVHDVAGDGFQGAGGVDVVIDRNEIGPAGANPDSSEHSDNIQIVDKDQNLQITNNWIHEQGYYAGTGGSSSGSTYIHGGSTGSLLYRNNLVTHSRGRVEIGGLGTGGTSRSNITISNNTIWDNGQAFANFPGFEWDIDSGTGNTIDHNLAIDPDGGFAQDGSLAAASWSANVWGTSATFDADGNCTSEACNPPGQPPIGYRKPTGVHW